MVILLDGIISVESPKPVPDPHPICLTPLPEREFTTPSTFFLSRPVRLLSKETKHSGLGCSFKVTNLLD
jgi:hypothetical protein